MFVLSKQYDFATRSGPEVEDWIPKCWTAHEVANNFLIVRCGKHKGPWSMSSARRSFDKALNDKER